VTGDLGLNADFEEVFADFDFKLVIATATLVLILLLLIYRAPIIAVIPLVVVLFAAQLANALIYLYAKATGDVSSNATQILLVLMFGVGTDYCLLLVSRYREELRRIEGKNERAGALRRSGPALGGQRRHVIAADAVLLLAEPAEPTRSGRSGHRVGLRRCLPA
jgi:RND superfamily putative drug exporter